MWVGLTEFLPIMSILIPYALWQAVFCPFINLQAISILLFLHAVFKGMCRIIQIKNFDILMKYTPNSRPYLDKFGRRPGLSINYL